MTPLFVATKKHKWCLYKTYLVGSPYLPWCLADREVETGVGTWTHRLVRTSWLGDIRSTERISRMKTFHSVALFHLTTVLERLGCVAPSECPHTPACSTSGTAQFKHRCGSIPNPKKIAHLFYNEYVSMQLYPPWSNWPPCSCCQGVAKVLQSIVTEIHVPVSFLWGDNVTLIL